MNTDNGCKYADKYLKKKGINQKSECINCPFYPDILRKCIYEYRRLFYYLGIKPVLKRDIVIMKLRNEGQHVRDIAKKFGIRSGTIRKIINS